MSRKMLIDATHPEETRVVVINGNKVEEFDFDASSLELITGNIYLAKVTRIEPSLQAAFVDYGGNRHGFLAFSEIHPDYFQIPQADREALIAEEIAAQEADEDDDEAESEAAEAQAKSKSRVRRRRSSKKTVAESTGEEPSIDQEVEATAEEDEANEGAEQADESAQANEDAIEANAADATDDSAETSEESAAEESDSESAPSVDVEDVLGDPRDHDAQADGEETAADAQEVESISSFDDEEEVREKRRKRKADYVRPHQRYKIQEVIKTRQVVLVQVLKEERGNKGAALTTYLSLPGRYCVLMPNTARGGGISRKISNVSDRKRLKALARSLDVPKGAGLIIRTAGAKQDSAEIERDYAFLTRQWNQIRELTLSSMAPAPVYAESGPIKRAIRDLLTNDTQEVLVEGEEGYKEAHEYMSILMPDRLKIVKKYEHTMPLFSRYQVESHLSSMFNPVVQLKSGGYLVIGVTEALIAIDVNSGRSTKQSSIEETALNTNLEAAEEVARQLKLRDLAGLIVIDFIDMEQRRNQQEVENRLKDALRKDRARIQVGRISIFGLLEMSRQRLRTGLVEAITQPCPHCHGTGIQRSDDNVALAVIRAIEEEIARGRSNKIEAHVPLSIANFLFNEKRDHINNFFTEQGVIVNVIADPEYISPSFKLEKMRLKELPLPKAAEPLKLESPEEEESGGKSKRRRRGGRGRGRSKSNGENGANGAEAAKAEDASQSDASPAQEDAGSKDDAKPKTKSSTRSRSSKRKTADAGDVAVTEASAKSEASEAAPQATDGEAEAPKPRRKRRTKAEIEADNAAKAAEKERKAAEKAEKQAKAAEAKAEKAKSTRKSSKTTSDEANGKAETEAPKAEDAPKPKASSSRSKAKAETASDESADAPTSAPKDDKPKRKGWWSL